MKDAGLQFTKALPNAAANNNTAAIDLNVSTTPTGNRSIEHRLVHVEVSYPALSDHTNTSVTNLVTLQDSSDNSTFTNTAPLVQCQVAGVASTGSVATTFKVPLPPAVKRYVRFNQNNPANGGTGNNATVTYDVVV